MTIPADANSPLRRALEEALAADPEDVAAHAAYADLLMERGGPADAARGELVRVHLALEAPACTPEEHDALTCRAHDLLGAHQRQWLGRLAGPLLDDRLADFRFRRGWLDALHVRELSLPLAPALKRAPEGRLLRELLIDAIAETDDGAEPGDGIPARARSVGLHPLVGAPFLGNVRRLRLGPDQRDDEYQDFRCRIHSSVLVPFVSQLPRLEELYLFANEYDLGALLRLPTLMHLRVLLVYHVAQVHRLQLLAERDAFRNLTHLLIHPHDLVEWYVNGDADEAAGYDREQGFLPLAVVRPLLRTRTLPRLAHLRLRCSSLGDEGCEEIVRSGILRRLETLDLRHGCITDEGARTLADCRDLRRLRWLDLDRNALSVRGIARIRALGIPARVEDQQALHDAETQRYLYEGETQ